MFFLRDSIEGKEQPHTWNYALEDLYKVESYQEKQINKWTVQDVTDWVIELSQDRFVNFFNELSSINGKQLLNITREELFECLKWNEKGCDRVGASLLWQQIQHLRTGRSGGWILQDDGFIGASTIEFDKHSSIKWGVSINLSKPADQWIVQQVKLFGQFAEKGVRAGWRIKRINGMLACPQNQQLLSSVLREGQMCTITFWPPRDISDELEPLKRDLELNMKEKLVAEEKKLKEKNVKQFDNQCEAYEKERQRLKQQLFKENAEILKRKEQEIQDQVRANSFQEISKLRLQVKDLENKLKKAKVDTAKSYVTQIQTMTAAYQVEKERLVQNHERAVMELKKSMEQIQKQNTKMQQNENERLQSIVEDLSRESKAHMKQDQMWQIRVKGYEREIRELKTKYREIKDNAGKAESNDKRLRELRKNLTKQKLQGRWNTADKMIVEVRGEIATFMRSLNAHTIYFSRTKGVDIPCVEIGNVEWQLRHTTDVNSLVWEDIRDKSKTAKWKRITSGDIQKVLSKNAELENELEKERKRNQIPWKNRSPLAMIQGDWKSSKHSIAVRNKKITFDQKQVFNAVSIGKKLQVTLTYVLWEFVPSKSGPDFLTWRQVRTNEEVIWTRLLDISPVDSNLKEIAALRQKELDKMREKVAMLEEQAKAKTASVVTELEAQKKQIGLFQEEIKSAELKTYASNEALKESRKSVLALEKERSELKAELAKQKKSVFNPRLQEKVSGLKKEVEQLKSQLKSAQTQLSQRDQRLKKVLAERDSANASLRSRSGNLVPPGLQKKPDPIPHKRLTDLTRETAQPKSNSKTKSSESKQPTEPMQIDSIEAALDLQKLFNGEWVNNEKKIMRINGHMVNQRPCFYVEDARSVHVMMGGKKHTAEVKDSKIYWAHGDVWVRNVRDQNGDTVTKKFERSRKKKKKSRFLRSKSQSKGKERQRDIERFPERRGR